MKKPWRNWADLPKDILTIIAGKLSRTNQVRFRGVCKSWKNIVHDILPWHGGFLACDDVFLDPKIWIFCCLLGPTSDESIEGIKCLGRKRGKRNSSRLHKFVNSQVQGSRYGWLFCCSNLRRSVFLFLYNPLTYDIWELPELHATDYDSILVEVSSSPASSDCIFFVLSHDVPNHQISLNICCKGDKGWRKHVLVTPGQFESIIYMAGTVYCVSSYGVLAAFSVSDLEWRVLTQRLDVMDIHVWYAYLVICNGELILVLIDDKARCRIFALDASSDPPAWVRRNTVGDQTLFLGGTSFSVSVSSVAEKFTDGIFFLDPFNISENDEIEIVFYSLKEDQKYPHPFSDYLATGKTEPTKWQKLKFNLMYKQLKTKNKMARREPIATYAQALNKKGVDEVKPMSSPHSSSSKSHYTSI
ncbi:F-box domain [Dillenia turbinata]|uniref:F-box domain n=1 Tax=Dillenia turbinata TaxID=194707 RepID=A0AAN8ZGY1_9MAGN